MNNIDRVLKDCLGTAGAETLVKSIIRLKTNSMADPSELYLPLLVVPRAILSWLIQNILPLKIGEYKDFQFPGQEDTVISVEKLDSDVYRGEFVRDAKVIHRFNHQTLPSISGHLLTVFELYDQLDIQAPKENQSGSMDMAAQIMAMNNINPHHQAPDPIAMKSLDMLGKLIDVLVAEKISKDKNIESPSKEDFIEKIKESVDKKIDEEEETIPMKKDELLMKPKKSYFSAKLDKLNQQKGVHIPIGGEGGESMAGESNRNAQNKGHQSEYHKLLARQKHTEKLGEQKAMPKPNLPKAEIQKAFEGASGAAIKGAPKMPVPPTAPGSKPIASQQADKSAAGKVAQPKPQTSVASPKTAAAPKMPTMPKMPKPAGQTFKSEGYFKKKLNKAQMVKSEKSYYCNESQIYKKCKLCLKPEFTKSETPKYTPCSCFKVTKSDFVALKKSGDGFLLSFAPTIDQDTIDSFLNILRE